MFIDVREHAMRGLVRAYQAHSWASAGLLAVVLAAAVATWPHMGLTIDLFYPKPARGVSGAELSALLLAAVVPSLTWSPMATEEHLSTRGGALGIMASAALLIPLLPFAAWYARVSLGGLGVTPDPEPFLATILLYAAVASMSVRWLGQIFGALLILVLYGALIAGQNWFGPGFGWRVFSTGTVWQTRWWVIAVAAAASVLIHIRLHGSHALRLTSSVG